MSGSQERSFTSTDSVSKYRVDLVGGMKVSLADINELYISTVAEQP